jgi:metal-responsive CopG/Arc/MetJ family transcriptional regulator
MAIEVVAWHPSRSLVFCRWNTMSVAKFAISVPKETMGQVDRAAKRLGLTRSRYIATVLARVAVKERDAAVTKKVDEVLAEMDQQDMDTLKHLLRARRDHGTEW